MEHLLEFASERQAEIIQALITHGSQRKAAEALGISNGTVSDAIRRVKRKAAHQGISPEHDMVHGVPDGFMTKGVSTMYGPDGEVRAQWVKSQIDNSREAITEAIAGLTEDLPKEAPTPSPAASEGHLLTVYPVGDHHFGMLAWGEETGGEDFDLKRGEELLTGAMGHLTTISPASKEAATLLRS